MEISSQLTYGNCFSRGEKMNVFLTMLLMISSTGMVDRVDTKTIIIHHSDSENGNAEIFRNYHVNVKKWEDVGYHYIITNGHGGPDGKIELGRPLEKKGAHAKKNNRNADSVGVCLVGKNSFTKKQKIATALLVARLCLDYDIVPSAKTIQTHHIDCPGPGLDIKEIIRKVKGFF